MFSKTDFCFDNPATPLNIYYHNHFSLTFGKKMMEASPNIHEIFHSPPVSLRVFIWHHMHFSHPFYEVVRPPLEHHSFFKKPFIRVLNVTTSGAQPFSSILNNKSVAFSIRPSLQRARIRMLYVTTSGARPLWYNLWNNSQATSSLLDLQKSVNKRIENVNRKFTIVAL